MINTENEKESLMLFCSIISDGDGSHGLHMANKLNALASIVLLGRGIVDDRVLQFLGFTEVRKEILLAVIKREQEQNFLSAFCKKFRFDKPNHGIAFTLPLMYLYKKNQPKYIHSDDQESEQEMKYQSIFVVVNKGYVDDVIEAAERAGSTGGTVIHGRGAGSEEKIRLFNIEVEPEKEILIILSEQGKTEKIVTTIQEELSIDGEGNGIIFVMDVSRAVGLYNGDEV